MRRALRILCVAIAIPGTNEIIPLPVRNAEALLREEYELIMLCILIMPGREYRKPVAAGFRKEKSEVRT